MKEEAISIHQGGRFIRCRIHPFRNHTKFHTILPNKAFNMSSLIVQMAGFGFILIVIFFLAVRHQDYIVEMSYHQQKEENYAKWQDTIWNSVEKEISLFQKKVTDCMLMLGDMSKKNKDDFKVEPCLQDDVILGEEFYTEMIRPFCVERQYLPKKPPTPAEVEDIHFQEEEERFKLLEETVVEKKDKKAAKKGAKGSGAKNDEKMKMEIVKGNFQKDIELVIKSHSLERMQVEFGLKQKKLELKLITFFYVAYYIRKNKVNQKIDQTEIFELINILIKMVRIFSHLQGPSFVDNSRKIEVSPTLIRDLKYCIKGLKEYYYYTNKTVIIKYPKLVYYTNYDRFFPTLDIKPYDSQIEFIQAVKSAFNERGNLNKPTLIFYRTMIGSGKTSASLALSQLVQECKLLDGIKNSNLQVVYTCLIGSVRVQVGRYCYNKGQKFALAAMEKSIKDENYYYPRIINSWSCKNEKVVDLIISDPHCTYEMLDRHRLSPEEEDIMKHESTNRKQKVHRGKLDRENIILFVDEPTAFCKNTESRATRKLFDILSNYPPRLTIFASATMPEAKELAKTIQLVKRKNPDLQVIEVNSKEFQIGCQYCSFKGEVIFPHTGVKDSTELKRIIDILKRNAFLLKLYTGPSLFFLLKKCEELGLQNLPRIDELPEVRQEDITKATFRILDILVKQKDEVIRTACALAKDETIMDFKEDVKKDSDDEMFDFMEEGAKEEKDEEEQEQAKEDFVNFKRMLKGDAYKFLGGCLIGTSDPIAFAHKMFERWVRKIKPIKRLKEKYDKEVEELDKEIRLLEDDPDMREEKKTQKISKLQSEKEPKLDFPEHKKINTSEHYQKYCKNKEASHWSMLIKPVPIEHSQILDLTEEVDDFILKLLFCGVAVYSERGLSPKYLDKVEELASSNFLAFIITDESLCYGTNFPISNVILTDDLVDKLNMNEMFQLIGRAGRVGQSWTARAFLEPHGLQKLNDYIHKPENQINDEGRIFEEIAEEHLRYPLLRLRNLHCEVRYLDGVENSENIEIEIKKKDAESHLIKGVALVPFTVTKNGNRYLCKNSYQNVKYYEFPSTALSYHDIPTLPNDGPINITAFYNNFKDFIYEIANNALLRILSEELQGKLPNYTILNHLKPKVYEPYYNQATGMLSILIHCKEEEGTKVGDYEFQSIIGNPFGDIDNILLERIGNLVDDAQRMSAIFLDNPLNANEQEIEKAMANYKDVSGREKAKFFQQMVNKALPEARATYERVADRVVDKQLLKSGEDVVRLLAISQIKDVRNCREDLFHIYPPIREIWQTIEKNAVVGP